MPLVSLVTLAIAYGQSKLAGGIAPWDKKLGLEVRAAIPRVRTAMAGAIAIVATFLVMIVNVATQKIMQRRISAQTFDSAAPNPFDQFDPKPEPDIFAKYGIPAPSGPTNQGAKQPDWDAGERTLPPCSGAYNATTWTNCAGEMTFSDGQKYFGGFRDGMRHGQGTHTWPSGQKYVGEFKDANYNGQGTLTFPSGDKYVGEFRDGQVNGQGAAYGADGTILQSGIWENGVFVRGR